MADEGYLLPHGVARRPSLKAALMMMKKEKSRTSALQCFCFLLVSNQMILFTEGVKCSVQGPRRGFCQNQVVPNLVQYSEPWYGI